MVIQFGYVSLFASAFPLAGALSLLCNLLELYNDKQKLLHVSRRPQAKRVSTIGLWMYVLKAMMVKQ